jgi:hypothetical protein
MALRLLKSAVSQPRLTQEDAIAIVVPNRRSTPASDVGAKPIRACAALSGYANFSFFPTDPSAMDITDGASFCCDRPLRMHIGSTPGITFRRRKCLLR